MKVSMKVVCVTSLVQSPKYVTSITHTHTHTHGLKSCIQSYILAVCKEIVEVVEK